MKPQLAKHLHLELEKKKPAISGLYMVTEKFDGIYAYIDFIDGEWGDITSRAGRVIPSLQFLTPTFKHSLREPLWNCRLIMEAVIDGMKFHELNGVFNRSKGACDAVGAKFIVHDVVPYNNTLNAVDRFRLIPSIIGEQDGGNRFERVDLLWLSSDIERWREAFNKVVENGGEGVVLKEADSLYHPDKRNSSLMKIKEEITADLLCKSIYFTKGKKGNDNLNALLKSKEGIEINVRIPKHEDVDAFTKDQSLIVGRVVEIGAMKKLPDGMYREPRFKAVRHDKNITEID